MKLKDKIENIPDNGKWWKESNYEDFVNYAKKLIDKGFSEDEAVDFLEEIYDIVSNEYGI